MCVHVCLGQFWGGVFVLLSSCCFVTLIVGLSMKSVYQICFYDWYGNLELSLYICLISMHMPLGFSRPLESTRQLGLLIYVVMGPLL